MRTTSYAAITLAACTAASLAACDGPQRMLDVRGPAAAQIAAVWWLILGFAIAVSIIIIAVLLLAVHRGRRRGAGADVREIDGRRLVWVGGVIVPLLLLFISLVASYRASSRIYPPRPAPADALTIDVIGHMFWWEIRYAGHDVVTANELRIPIGRPVRLRLGTGDVIHSFWVPQLHGKMDQVPGRTNELWIRADSAGVFRGQCAEYCGLSHALMALWVIAVEPAELDAWLASRQQRPALIADAQVESGRGVFDAAGCAQCHSTPDAPLPQHMAGAAPDLGDFGTRRSIGAGRLPNTQENLASWIADPQRLKPGNRMPGTRLSRADMDALIAYLYSLR